MFELVKYPDPILRAKCDDWDIFDESQIQPLIELKNAMESTCERFGGIGLAACQIGVTKNVIWLHGEMKLLIVNPSILEVSEERNVAKEGCLSIGEGGRQFSVTRYNKVRVKGFTIDQGGKRDVKEWDFGMLWARVFQHEFDHINGVLYIDRVKKIDKPMVIRAFGLESKDQYPVNIRDLKDYLK